MLHYYEYGGYWYFGCNTNPQIKKDPMRWQGYILMDGHIFEIKLFLN